MIDVFDVERYTSFNIRVRVCPTNVSTDGWNFGDSACGRVECPDCAPAFLGHTSREAGF